MDLPTLRARVRKDLRDETPSDQHWSDGELDRHIARAVDEASLAAPRELTATLTSAGTRNLSISTITGLIAVEAVEYPIDQDPASFTLFSLWGTTLTVLGPSVPPASSAVRVYYGARHTLDATSSTLPVDLEDTVATGAVAYAALAWAAHAANRINVGGPDVWRSYHTLGQEHLARFAKDLARRSRRGAVRTHRLYRPARTGPLGPSQTTDPGP